MSQAETNRAEWRNPANWSGPKWLSVYFSKQDNRVWVPKQLPWMGWTINFGQPAGVAWLLAILLLGFLVPTIALIVVAVGLS